MPKVAVYNIDGTKTGEELELNDYVFGVEFNEAVVHQAVVMQRAAQRHGTAATKTRAMVRGGGRKPFRQKGTGRARAGTIRSPLWIGGGVVFGPHPRSYKKQMTRKARRLAIRSALSARVAAGELLIVDNLTLEAPKTKEAVKIVNAFEAKKPLFITDGPDENLFKSVRNIPSAKALSNEYMNVYDLLHYDKILLDRTAIARIEEVLS